MCLPILIFSFQYVDENYQGGGIGEYSYYNPTKQAWDNSACNAHGNGRCAPMDCHETNTTTWKLMGVFKEASFFGNDAFFEQLFKHEGICVWNNDDLYSFMQTARKNYWPSGCISTGMQIKNSYSNSYGSYLYLDLRPTWNGNMTYGLYSDAICKNEYDLPDMNVDTISKNLGLLYGSTLQKWNTGLEAFKVCQPCKAYSLKNTYASSNYYGSYSDSSDPNNGYFQCYDDADYTNVNQCMKFRSHAQLEVCTWEDLVSATNQGGILEVKVGDTIFGSERITKEEYQSLMKAQKESNLKWSKAQAQTVAMYRMEAEKVEAMKPAAQRWSSLGSTSIAIGAIAMLGAVFWVTKRHIDRMFPPKALSEPLLQPSREFLEKEFKSSGDNNSNNLSEPLQKAVPFGSDSDDDDSAIRKDGTNDDNTSVSSLSYVSTSPDPATSQNRAVDTDVIAKWYKNVKTIDSHGSWAESVVKEDAEDENKHEDGNHETMNLNENDGNENKNAEVVVPQTTETLEEEFQGTMTNIASGDVTDDASDVFEGIDPSSDAPDIEAAIVAPDTTTLIGCDALLDKVIDMSNEANMSNDEMSTKSIVFLGDVSVASRGEVLKVDDHELNTNCDEVTAHETETSVQNVDNAIAVEDVPVQDIINDDDIDAHSQEETARMSNVSLEEINHPETEMEYPDEMIQYLSMSASEEGEIGDVPDIETATDEVVPDYDSSNIVEPTMSIREEEKLGDVPDIELATDEVVSGSDASNEVEPNEVELNEVEPNMSANEEGEVGNVPDIEMATDEVVLGYDAPNSVEPTVADLQSNQVDEDPQ